MSRPSQRIDLIILTKYYQSQSYITTDGQSASLCFKPPSGVQDKIFITVSFGLVDVGCPL
jgi:hypothetical protein